MKTNTLSRPGKNTWIIAVFMLVFGQVGRAAPPDLTQGVPVDRTQTYNLGSTGLRGWIYTKPADFLDSAQGRTTTASRQILVTHVGKGTPAAGILQVNDVILGVAGKPFSADARKSIAIAIQEAEKETNSGMLSLTRWRAGKTEGVQLKLQVMGTYSDTAPYDCPKSKRILAAACQVLEKEPLTDDLWGAVTCLALLSTGQPEYLPRIREYAHRTAPRTLKLELKDGMFVWDWGYRGLFLSEYYLLTGDEAVLPAIREYTVALAKGQSLYGTFGHGISGRTASGELHGSIPPYGPVNAAGLVGNLAIVMGRRCGIDDPEIDPAIERASRFFGYFVDKGSIPYGEHEPWPYHENNGKNAITALMFATQGDKNPETRFFAKMCTAAYQNREYGHTGQGFSYLWGALGANTGGPEAAAAFFREASWHFDLVRRPDGSFTYDGGEQYGGGRTEGNTYEGASSYYGLSPAATYVLTYSLPLKNLFITGKQASPANQLTSREVSEAVASARFDLERRQKSVPELVHAFSDWSPIVRSWAAEELSKRPEAKGMVAQLKVLAEGPEIAVCQGACETLGFLQEKTALPVFIRLLHHPDRWLRFKAAQAIRKLGGQAKSAIPEILQAIAETTEPLQPINWADPIQLTHGQLAAALFAGPLADHVMSADRELIYPAIRAVSRNADGMARATLRGFIDRRLSAEDVQALSGDIFSAVKTPSPADTMFSNEIRMAGFKALTKYHFQEGVEAGVQFAKTQGGHGSENRTGEIMKEIQEYGTAAREAVPALRELIDEFHAQCKKGEFPAGELNDRRVSAVQDAIRFIEAATTHPDLRRIAPGDARKPKP